MKFIIASPHFTKEYTITWLEVTTPQGNLVIQPGHAPIILVLSAEKKMTFMLDSGKEEVIHLNNLGFLEVQRNEILALLNEE